ncbi:MAG TPA: DUF881 domain-containing protein [Ruania sp.]|nr:DUF881 domain-containing protein [Ruania sp.]
MVDPPDQSPQPPHRSGMSLGVAVVGVLAGLLFATNASLFADVEGRQPMNLQDLVRSESQHLEQTNSEVRDLQDRVDALVAEQSRANPDVAAGPALSFASGRTGAEGEGVVVSMWDSPLIHDIPEGFHADDLLVHEQDLWAVLNALWNGGADAVSIQGHRVGPLTDIRCVGNVLLLDGYTYSPPYVLAAIGDPDELTAALDASAAVQDYRTYVDAVSLGWSLEERETITMPAIEGGLSMQYAHLPGEEPITLDSPPDGH